MSSRLLIASLVLGSSLLQGTFALAGPPTAEAVLAAAVKAGRPEKKNILVVFHASWCGWCRKLEAVLSVPEVKEVLGRYFETVELTVLERGEKKALENAGAEELLVEVAGRDAGLPFTAVFDRKSRRVLATSNTSGPGTNIGFPGKVDELDHFVAMLRRGAPRMTAAEAETIRSAFPAPK